MREIVTIYDELNRAYMCEVEGTRVLQVLEAPPESDWMDREYQLLQAYACGYQD